MRDLDDPYAGLADLRDNNPVARFGDSEFYAVTSWDLIAEAVARTDDFSSNLTATMVWHDDGQVTGFPVAELGSSMHVLATADDPRHRMHRRIIMPSLTARRVSRLEPFIEQTLVDLWATGVVGDRVDWVESIAQRLPMAVVAELLGLPDYDIAELIRWSFTSTVLLDGVVTADRLESATAAVGELSAYLTAAFDRALAEPGDDVLRDLARLVHCGDLDQDSAVMILIQLVAAGDSTVSLLGTSVWLLARHPDIVAALAADRELIPRCSSRKYCGWSRRSADTIGMSSTTPPSVRHRYPPDRTSTSCGVRPIATRQSSTTRTRSASTHPTVARTWHSAREFTYASVRHWHDWKRAWASLSYWTRPPNSDWPRRTHNGNGV